MMNDYWADGAPTRMEELREKNYSLTKRNEWLEARLNEARAERDNQARPLSEALEHNRKLDKLLTQVRADRDAYEAQRDKMSAMYDHAAAQARMWMDAREAIAKELQEQRRLNYKQRLLLDEYKRRQKPNGGLLKKINQLQAQKRKWKRLHRQAVGEWNKTTWQLVSAKSALDRANQDLVRAQVELAATKPVDGMPGPITLQMIQKPTVSEGDTVRVHRGDASADYVVSSSNPDSVQSPFRSTEDRLQLMQEEINAAHERIKDLQKTVSRLSVRKW